MSVINQMLRDLDRRTMPAERAIYASRIERASSHRFAWRQWLVASVVIAGGIALSMTVANMQWSTHRAVLSGIDPAPAAPDARLAAITPAVPEAARPALQPTTPVEAPAVVRDSEQVRSASTVAPPSAHKPIERAPTAKVAARQSASARDPLNQSTELAALAVQPPPSGNAADRARAPAIDLPRANTSPTPETDQRIIREDATRTADSEYRYAAALMDQGRLKEAQQRLHNALDLNARHEAARQTLAALLLEERSYDAAAEVLSTGLRHNPAQTNFAVALSRLHLERGNMPAAIAVLREHASHAIAHPEYRAFAAALYGKSGAHADAIVEYEAALKLAPQMGSWWIGLGLAYEAEDHTEAATDAYRKARATGALSASLNQFIERKLQRKQ